MNCAQKIKTPTHSVAVFHIQRYGVKTVPKVFAACKAQCTNKYSVICVREHLAVSVPLICNSFIIICTSISMEMYLSISADCVESFENL